MARGYNSDTDINIITGKPAESYVKTPQSWGNSISYERVYFQDGNNLPLVDTANF